MSTTTTKERPIIFNGEMLRAILEGRKTQTRRVAVLPKSWPSKLDADALHEANIFVPEGVPVPHPEKPRSDNRKSDFLHCPYGKVGDRLWVRENFQPLWTDDDHEAERDYSSGRGYKVNYIATDGVAEYYDKDDEVRSRVNPSIHMPRWASRITLEITEVRLEPLHAISEEDVRAEGVAPAKAGRGASEWKDYASKIAPRGAVWCPVTSFQVLWDSINGKKESRAWKDNPLVWVVGFKLVGEAA